MASIDYLATLPDPLSGSFRYNATDPWVSDSSEVGAPRRRARFTRVLHRWTYDLVLTNSQKDALITFYETTLSNGVSEFNWTDPDTDTVYEARFAQRPDISHVDAAVWRASVQIEEI